MCNIFMQFRIPFLVRGKQTLITNLKVKCNGNLTGEGRFWPFWTSTGTQLFHALSCTSIYFWMFLSWVLKHKTWILPGDKVIAFILLVFLFFWTLAPQIKASTNHLVLFTYEDYNSLTRSLSSKLYRRQTLLLLSTLTKTVSFFSGALFPFLSFTIKP